MYLLFSLQAETHWGGDLNRAALRSRASNQPSGLLLSARVPTSRNVYRGDFRFYRIVLYDAAFFMSKKLWQTVPGSEL